MTYLLYLTLFALLLFGLGIGLVLLLVPGRFRRYSVVFAPVVGYCYLTLAAWYLLS